MLDSFVGGNTRRLPVYLLLDCSGSMQGAPIKAVEEGLQSICDLLMEDARAVDTVYISVICFAAQAKQYELVALPDFVPPNLVANGPTALGDALQLLVESITKDLRGNEGGRHGDYCPLVFLLTDGVPTDKYESGIQRLKQLPGSKRPTVVALGCGSQVNRNVLNQLASNPNNVFLIHQATEGQIRSFFRWMSGSIVGTVKAGGTYTATAYAGDVFPR